MTDQLNNDPLVGGPPVGGGVGPYQGGAFGRDSIPDMGSLIQALVGLISTPTAEAFPNPQGLPAGEQQGLFGETPAQAPQLYGDPSGGPQLPPGGAQPGGHPQIGGIPPTARPGMQLGNTPDIPLQAPPFVPGNIGGALTGLNAQHKVMTNASRCR